MTPLAIKAAREAMCMSPADLAEIMEVGRAEIYRMEADPKTKTARTPPKRFIKLLKALQAGWRP